MSETLVRQLPKLHAAQQAIFDSKARFKVVYGGRRVGKTELGVDEIIRGCCTLPGLYWWVGLTWQAASMKRAWRLLKARFRGLADIHESTHEIILGNGSEVWLRTAEREDALDGEGMRGVVLDEFTLMGPRVFHEHIRAGLSDFAGWATFIGVPKGRNWSFGLWQKAQDPSFPTWEGWQIPTSANPFIDPAEIEEARRDMPEDLFSQEYLAAIVDDSGSVFRRILEAATVKPIEDAIDGHSYVFGVDWAKTNDFTVITVLDEASGDVVALDRFNQIDYTIQKQRLLALAGRFRPSAVIAERNSIGEPLIEDLEAAGLPIRPFLTTNQSKAQAIELLSAAFERGEIHIPEAGPHAKALINELQCYEQERLPSGLTKYGAPEGSHDDTVMSLAFAWFGARGTGQFISYLKQQLAAKRAAA